MGGLQMTTVQVCRLQALVLSVPLLRQAFQIFCWVQLQWQ